MPETIVTALPEGAGPEEAAWEAFVAGHLDATFFHRPGWRRVIRAAYGHRAHYRLARRGGEIVGVLPLIQVRSPVFGHNLISLGFAVYGGILAADAAAAQALADDAEALGRRLGVATVELRHVRPLALGPDWLAKDGLYATFRRPITGREDEDLKAIPRKKRADVRKALGNPDLKIDVAAPTALFWRIYGESVRNLGTPVPPLRYFAAIQAEFGDAVEISSVQGPDGTPVAALMTYYFRDTVLPYYGGATPAARPLHAYDLMYFALMGRAAARGARIFDFGRSKRGTGAFDFKTYWGFEPEPLTYQFRLIRARDLPDVNPLNPKYRLMVETWQRLPLWISQRIGPILAGQLG